MIAERGNDTFFSLSCQVVFGKWTDPSEVVVMRFILLNSCGRRGRIDYSMDICYTTCIKSDCLSLEWELMPDFWNVLQYVLFMSIIIGSEAFTALSVFFFIRDGIRAKREGRERKPAFTRMFIAGIVVQALWVVLFLLFVCLAFLVLMSM